MSNNKINSLSGIEVFKKLTHLSICFNKIEKVQELERITNKTNLISLSVKGNFFCTNPNSNIQIIEMFSNLKDLDSYKVTESSVNVIRGIKIY